MGGCASTPIIKTELTPIQELDSVKAKSAAPLDFTIDKATDIKIKKLAHKRGI